MIDKHYNAYLLVCDICGEEPPESFDTFDEAVDHKKEMGWTCKRGELLNFKNGWIDLCPHCK